MICYFQIIWVSEFTGKILEFMKEFSKFTEYKDQNTAKQNKV